MMQKPWFKAFIWFLATFFFFLASTVLISIFSPGPTETQVHQFMAGSMAAMDQSMMGVAMNLSHDTFLTSAIILTSYLTVPLIILGFFLGLLVRLRRSLCSTKS